MCKEYEQTKLFKLIDDLGIKLILNHLKELLQFIVAGQIKLNLDKSALSFISPVLLIILKVITKIKLFCANECSN
jgi:hypothetical protein